MKNNIKCIAKFNVGEHINVEYTYMLDEEGIREFMALLFFFNSKMRNHDPER